MVREILNEEITPSGGENNLFVGQWLGRGLIDGLKHDGDDYKQDFKGWKSNLQQFYFQSLEKSEKAKKSVWKHTQKQSGEAKESLLNSDTKS